jgi:hypothetical protein
LPCGPQETQIGSLAMKTSKITLSSAEIRKKYFLCDVDGLAAILNF